MENTEVRRDIDFYFEEMSYPESLATRLCCDVGASAEVHFLTFPHGGKMAANEEKQQGHRPGIYKQRNKGHKHGKHRTKGEIERENKGKPVGLSDEAARLLMSAGSALLMHVLYEFSREVCDTVRSQGTVPHAYLVKCPHFLVLRRLSFGT